MPVIEKLSSPPSIIQESSFKLIFEYAAVGIAQIDEKGQLLMVNNKFCEITGYPKEELLQKTFQEFTHPDDLESDLKQTAALFRGEINSFSMEKRYIRKNGTIVWVKLTGSAVFDEHGKFITFVGVVEDISDRKKAETALLIAEKYYKIASSAAKIGTYYRNLETGEDFWSPELLNIFGLKAGDPFPLIDGIPAAVHPEDRKYVLEQAQKHFDPSLNLEFNSDHRIIVPDGTIRWINVRGVTEFNFQKNPIKTYGIGMDITTRKEAEEALQVSEEKFRLLANNMSQLAWMMDNTGWVFWYNQRWFDYTGTTLEEMQGWGWQKVQHPDHVQRVIKGIKHVIESGEDWEDLFPLKSKEGTYRWFLTHLIPLRDGNGKIIRWLGTNTDVTQRQIFEEQLKNDNKLFEDLLYVAAHDLKAPVANMYGALNMMDRLPIEKKIRLLTRFRDLADQLNNTIHGVTEILSMRNEARSAASEINIGKVLDKAMLQFNSQLTYVSIVRKLEKPTIFYIELFLYSIIGNLIDNALKFRRQDVPLHIEVSSSTKNEFTLLSVCDNGIGIDLESYGEKIFFPLQQLNPKKTQGAGIGLYLIKGIVEKNGGYITVESTPGEGSKFCCYLKEY